MEAKVEKPVFKLFLIGDASSSSLRPSDSVVDTDRVANKCRELVESNKSTV